MRTPFSTIFMGETKKNNSFWNVNNVRTLEYSPTIIKEKFFAS